jgi:hypothetical protein
MLKKDYLFVAYMVTLSVVLIFFIVKAANAAILTTPRPPVYVLVAQSGDGIAINYFESMVDCLSAGKRILARYPKAEYRCGLMDNQPVKGRPEHE